MANLYQGVAFSPQTTLSENIGAADTIIKVSDSSVFPDPPNYATIGTDELGETIEYAAKAEGLLSGCTRGVEGTAKSWQKGDVIARNFTAKDHNDMITAVTTAKQTANNASSAATAAQQTADSASTAAETAQDSANTAQETADNAQSTANTAKATAEAALPLSGGTLTGMLSGGLTNEGPEYFYRTTNNTKFVISKPTESTEGVDLRFMPSSAAPQTASRTVTFDGVKTPVNNYEAANKLYVDSAILKPNLILNWYFANTVNQRGKTEYIDKGQTIDRWKNTNSNLTVTVLSDCIRLTAKSSGHGYLCHVFEKDLPAGTYTYSALVRGSGKGFMNVTNMTTTPGIFGPNAEIDNPGDEWTLVTNTFACSEDILEQTYFRCNKGTTYDILACKLEYGNYQTLAHKEGNIWVLNEIPDYKEELIKCQKYFFELFNSTRGQSYIAICTAISSNLMYGKINIPLDLKTKPILQTNCSESSPYFAFGCVNGVYKNTIKVTDLSIFSYDNSSVILKCTCDNVLTPGTQYQIYVHKQSQNSLSFSNEP